MIGALQTATDQRQFSENLLRRAETLALQPTPERDYRRRSSLMSLTKAQANFKFGFASGIRKDARRYKRFISDIVDGFVGPNTIRKSLATIVFLYFTCILPCIAFGVLNYKNTDGKIGARRALLGQAIGGLAFHLLAGQPLVIIATTAPLCLYLKVVYDIAASFGVDFFAMFACVGLWNSLFVIIFSLFDLSNVMEFCTRSTEEIFALFIFFAFTVDALKDCVKSFDAFYCKSNFSASQFSNHSMEQVDCAPENSILFLFLMIATLWLAVFLYNMNRTSFFNKTVRQIISDYALALSVVFFSFVGSFLFREIDVEKFDISEELELKLTNLSQLKPSSVIISAVLGFPLALLFFMDQNISAALVQNPNNKLRKGTAYHLDLLIVALINVFTSLVGLPWMHGILPHSPLHARMLADVELHNVDGQIREVVVKARETRVTGLVTHVLILLSAYFLVDVLVYIPVPILSGLFLYCAVGTTRGNSFFERILLLFTESNAYPPNRFVQRCPQRSIHLFTATQIFLLLVLCLFGFFPQPYVQMTFPVVIALFIPFRWFLMPKIVERKYLEEIDGYH